ncbi:ATP-binding protein [Vibrio viridaestus]|uniref:histidine kinase n=1 Tax=Vibrio viridaestus TaxID=2487322 RepID=A0A3N9TKC3_9VIBR|nr:sensor histidine kinase [Vibrio viridaestus]RQW64424.1 sensor histidine kinase [Vibrio viridaestus]
MKLKNYLTLSTVAATSSIVIIVTVALLYLLQHSYHEGLKARGLELGAVIAHDPIVINSVRDKNEGMPQYVLQHYIESIRSRTDASFIVVVDKNAIRLSHPDALKVGKKFVGNDIHRALSQGEQYSTIDTGSLGKAIRNFVPVVMNGKVIGAVCIGYLSEQISDILQKQFIQIIVLIAGVYLVGLCVTVAFLTKIKRTFFDFEPEYIANKFREHEMVFDSIRDAIIATDQDMKVTLINDRAMKMLSMGILDRADFIDQLLSRYSVSLSHLILQNPEKFQQGEFSLGHQTYQADIYPIITAKGLRGHVIVFFVKSTANDMENELTYLKNYSELLRSKTHEYSNKLNVLSGMLQIGKYDECIEFIQQEADGYQSIINQIVRSIANSAIAGLLLAKFNKASRMGVQFKLDSDSSFSAYEKDISEKVVTILGNLIDNALLAAWENRHQQTNPFVSIYISDRSKHMMIEVEDNGVGVPSDIEDNILEFGVTSKNTDDQNGVGLYLVKQLVDYMNGSIDWERTEDNSTLFSVYLEKKVATDEK